MRNNLPVTNQEYVIPDGEVIVSHTDLDSHIVYANEAFVRSSGYTRKECIGQPHNFVRHPDMPPEAFADLWSTARSGKAWTGIVKNRRKNGDFYWVRANVTPIIKDGKITGYMSVRVRPTKEEVDAARSLYAAMREGRAKNLSLSGGDLLRTDLVGVLQRLMRLPMATRLWLSNGSIALVLTAIALGQWLVGAGTYAGALATLSLVGAGLMLLTAAYLTRFVASPLAEMIEVAGKVCGGEVQAQFPQKGDYDLRKFSRLVNQMNAKIGGVVMDVHWALEIMDEATTEVADGNNDLSSRTEEQASSLEETASSMEELTSTVKMNAENARQANQMTVGTSEVAVKGGEVVRQVVDTMTGISEQSKKIADIIGVIDGIAFQTNILALNAAVEAARAGEQGRGFAVVASEVRNLAQRSAAAAKEIKVLITDSSSKVDAGSRQVNQAGMTMDEIVTSVKKVADLMADITAASQEQSQGIEQVNIAISQMDEVTQQNAALVEEAAAAAESLKEQGQLIVTAVSVFSFNAAASGNGRARLKSRASHSAATQRTTSMAATRPSAKARPKLVMQAGGGKDAWEEF